MIETSVESRICSRKRRNRVLGLLALVVVPCLALAAQEPDPGQVEDTSQTQPQVEPPVGDAAAGVAEPGGTPVGEAELLGEPSGMDPVSDYGLWVLTPAIVAIFLAIFTRQVVPALLIGIFVAAFMALPCRPPEDSYREAGTVVGGVRLTVEQYIFGAISEPPEEEKNFAHLKIILFTLIIGFVVGVIGRNGGTAGMVSLIAGETRSRRRGALTAWFAGLVVFFDDYANTMIVGPTMRSVFDRLRLSRAKLAYIVDSTAAPVSSIALIGTWVGTEVGLIQQGLDDVARSGAPMLQSSGEPLTGMQGFLYSIPYRFYPLLALVLVFLVAVTGRDFGPMKRSERKSLSKVDPVPAVSVSADSSSGLAPPRWWLGIIPIAVLVIGTLGVLAASGLSSASTVAAMNALGADGERLWEQKAWWDQASSVIGNADTGLSIFYGAFLAAVVAVLLTMLARACSARDAVDAGLEGLARMSPAIVILVLAWALSTVLRDLQLGQIVADHLDRAEFDPKWLPMCVFITAALVSFATGTSWGTMGILCPMTVAIGARLVLEVNPTEAMPLMYASIGSVLAGAVFGDHCSPISDTTVLSSIAAGCRHEEHVWTQIPYALVAGVAAIGLGDVLCSVYHQPWYYGLGAGCVFLFLWVFIVGRRPVASPAEALPDPEPNLSVGA